MKIRIYDTKKNKWLDHATAMNHAIFGQKPGDTTLVIEWADWHVVHRSTGLLDKVGVEIYEGDVVQRYTIDKRSKYQKLQADRVPFTVVWRTSRVHNGWNIASGIFEVVGNIYKELFV